jgi:hypothetical protein
VLALGSLASEASGQHDVGEEGNDATPGYTTPQTTSAYTDMGMGRHSTRSARGACVSTSASDYAARPLPSCAPLLFLRYHHRTRLPIFRASPTAPRLWSHRTAFRLVVVPIL